MILGICSNHRSQLGLPCPLFTAFGLGDADVPAFCAGTEQESLCFKLGFGFHAFSIPGIGVLFLGFLRLLLPLAAVEVAAQRSRGQSSPNGGLAPCSHTTALTLIFR